MTNADVELMNRAMQLAASNSTQDVATAEEVAAQIAGNILAAETVEDVFAAASAGLETAESLLDIPQLITDVDWRHSGFGKGQVYASVTSVDANGIQHVWGCGGGSVMTQLWRFGQLDAFPLVAVLKGKQTNSGNTVYMLVPATPEQRKPFENGDGIVA